MASIQNRTDQENRTSELQRLNEDTTGHVPVQKRAVLGTLNANARILPNRNSKQELKKKCDEVFQILKDEDIQPPAAPVVDATSKLNAVVKLQVNAVTKVEKELPGAVTALARPPLKDVKREEEDMVVSEDSYIESPMQLDKSTSSVTSPTAKGRTSMHRQLFDMDEYRDDLYDYLLEIEVLHRPKPGYMRRQPDITYAMRTILIEWLVEVAEEYKMHNDTLYLAVSYIDRFLSLMSVVRSKLQLVGTAAMFIAAKYEQVFAPDINEFVYITDDTYTKRQVLRMEQLILKVLNFDISSPTALGFITLYCVSFNLPEKVMHLAMYISELTLLEGDPYLQYRPSLLAASTVALAQHTVGLEAWPVEMAEGSGYDLTALYPCISDLNMTHARAPEIPQQAVREKYKMSKWNSVSVIPSCALKVPLSDSK